MAKRKYGVMWRGDDCTVEASSPIDAARKAARRWSIPGNRRLFVMVARNAERYRTREFKVKVDGRRSGTSYRDVVEVKP